MIGLLTVAASLALQAPSGAAAPGPAEPSSSASKAGERAPAFGDAFLAAQPGCEGARYCFGVHLYVVTREGRPAQSPAWLATQLREANRHFAAIHTAFELVAVEALDAELGHVATREDRDAIGLARFTRGTVAVFLVERLDDVDVPGAQIRGLHWRQRSNTEKRWVILSAIAPDMVLAHELGHFFSLPHSTHAVSIMNKRPREDPPRAERTFATPEVVQMRQARNAMVAAGMLRARGRR